METKSILSPTVQSLLWISKVGEITCLRMEKHLLISGVPDDVRDLHFIIRVLETPVKAESYFVTLQGWVSA